MTSIRADREAMEYDVVIVGGGPSGLAAAIRLKQLAAENDREISVCILEKGGEIGAHILSGAVMDPRALTELLPDWQAQGAPLLQPVTGDEVLFLNARGAMRTPDWLVPACLHNDGNFVISLGAVTKWLAEQAEALGVEIFPGFAAAEVLYDDAGAVRGVATGNLGVGKDGQPHGGFQLGMELLGKFTVFAEGARGQLGKQLIARFQLDEGRDPQTYAIGVKEGWPRFRKFPPKSDLRRCRTRTFWRQKSCQYRRHHLWLHGATVVTAPAHAAAFFLVPLGWGAVAARRSTNPCTVWASMR